jgi:hypothetical protein
MRVTNPSYISQQMFDNAVREKFQNNPDDGAVREQAIQLLQLARGSKWRGQILVDIMHAAKVSRQVSTEQTVEIAFCMGLQFGFELALSYPPLPPS